MKRKTSTPKATPRSAEVINLADRRKPEPGESEYLEILMPENSQPDDIFTAIQVQEREPDTGARPGDVYICYNTQDVQKGDFALLSIEGAECGEGGIFDSDACYFYIDDEPYHRSKATIVGRVVELRRGPRRITPKIHFRPIRESATIYQFKARGGAR
jgi:hypothetical protein